MVLRMHVSTKVLLCKSIDTLVVHRVVTQPIERSLGVMETVGFMFDARQG